MTEWAGEDIAIDVFHHLVYIGTTALAYELLTRDWAARRGSPRNAETR